MTVPLPPRDLDAREPLVVENPAGTTLHRLYAAAYNPIFSTHRRSVVSMRPDASYGVPYVSENKAGAFAQTFLRAPGRPLIDTGLLSRRAYIKVATTRSLSFICLAGPGLARLEATAEVTHGGLPYDAQQAWSIALSKHPVKADGIAYYSRHDDEELCFGIFDSARSPIVELARETDLDQDWLWGTAERYGVGLAP